MFSVRIQVNGEFREFDAPLSIQDLIANLSLRLERLAIEVNGTVIRRADWGQTMLNPNDRIEIVHFVGGGCATSGNRHQAGAAI